MFLVGPSQVHVTVTFKMYMKCIWWEHAREMGPVPSMFLTCSHPFPEALAPSVIFNAIRLQLVGGPHTVILPPCTRLIGKSHGEVLPATVYDHLEGVHSVLTRDVEDQVC